MTGNETILQYLTNVPAWYLATSVNDQPHVRPFSFAAEQDGKIWFCTATTKDVWDELVANPKFEATAWWPGHGWLILRGRAGLEDKVNDDIRYAGFAQHIGHACHQRRFRADDHQVDGVALHELQNGLAILGVQARHVLRDGVRSTVARGRVQVVGTGGFRQGPRNGVLTAAAAQNQDVHVTNPPFPALG